MMLMRISVLALVGLLPACQNSSEGPESSVPVVKEQNCLVKPDVVNWQELLTTNCNRLSNYGLFDDSADPTIHPREPGLKFDLATPLFSDYAKKSRFVFMPDGKSATYSELETLEFPVGTVLVKSFALPDANVGATGEDLIETRLLIHRHGGWVGLPYVWNADKTEAFLELSGRKVNKSILQDGVARNYSYQVPAVADCRNCHLKRDEKKSWMMPIGPKVRQLNFEIDYPEGRQNQLEKWRSTERLKNLPEDFNLLITVPQWGDQSSSLQDRAKGYLDINCAHCHTPGGSGTESGMYLEFWREPKYFDHGVCKRPGGFNGGDKGLVYDLMPGDADQSLIPYRMSLLVSEGDPKGQMPPLARSLNHLEAIELVEDWINSMAPVECR